MPEHNMYDIHAQLGVLEALLTTYAQGGQRSLESINDELKKARVLVDKRDTLLALAKLQDIRYAPCL